MHTMRLQLSPLHSASHQLTVNLAGQRTLCSCQRGCVKRLIFGWATMQQLCSYAAACCTMRQLCSAPVRSPLDLRLHCM
jgi:hypothetical protein